MDSRIERSSSNTVDVYVHAFRWALKHLCRTIWHGICCGYRSHSSFRCGRRFIRTTPRSDSCSASDNIDPDSGLFAITQWRLRLSLSPKHGTLWVGSGRRSQVIPMKRRAHNHISTKSKNKQPSRRRCRSIHH